MKGTLKYILKERAKLMLMRDLSNDEVSYRIWKCILDCAADLPDNTTEVLLSHGVKHNSDPTKSMIMLNVYSRAPYDIYPDAANSVIINEVHIDRTSHSFPKGEGWFDGNTTEQVLDKINIAKKELKRLSDQYFRDLSAYSSRKGLEVSEAGFLLGIFSFFLFLKQTGVF